MRRKTAIGHTRSRRPRTLLLYGSFTRCYTSRIESQAQVIVGSCEYHVASPHESRGRRNNLINNDMCRILSAGAEFVADGCG